VKGPDLSVIDWSYCSMNDVTTALTEEPVASDDRTGAGECEASDETQAELV
jgi:hypothetical protein